MVYLSVVLPCRDENKTIGMCIDRIREAFADNDIHGEIIVSDSSRDDSAQIAKSKGAKVIRHKSKGYGIACMEGINQAKGKYIIIGDADATYDFAEIPLFLRKLEDGHDLVIGTRLSGDIRPGSMPLLHRLIGNPVLSGIMNLFFHTKISDSNSGFRAISRKKLEKLGLKTTGMEFASEMIIKASKSGYKIGEVPITYYPRIGESKLKSWSDGWRHLRFMLMFSPTYLFFIPGILLMAGGLALLVLLLFGTVYAGGSDIGIHLSILSALTAVLGYQIISIGLYSRIYAIHTGFEKNDKMIDFIADKMPLERGILFSFILILSGILSFSLLFRQLTFYPGLLLSLVLLILGVQTMFSVFFISMMVIEKK